MMSEVFRGMCWLSVVFSAFYIFGIGLAAVVHRDEHESMVAFVASAICMMVASFLKVPK